MSGLPATWEVTSVGEVAEIQLGRQRSPQHHSGRHMRPYLRAANVTWNGVALDDVKQMNFEPEEAAIYELRAGDILLNEASGSPNEVGKSIIWNGEIPGCCFQNTLLRVRSGHMNKRYLHWYFTWSALAGRFGEAGRGVNIRHLGKAGLSTFLIPVPPVREQERVVAAIEEYLSRLDAAMASLAKVAVVDLGIGRSQRRAAALRRALLRAAFSGRLVAQDPAEEPASALLERIKNSRHAKPRRRSFAHD